MSEDYNIAEEISSIINNLKQENISGNEEECEENEEEFGENEEETSNSNNSNLNEEDDHFDDNYDIVEVNIEEEEDNPNPFKPKKERKKYIGKKQKLAETTTDYIKCSECDKYFSIRRLFIHREEAHQIPRFFCKFCNVDFLNKDDYNRHLDVVHPKRFDCSVCHQLFLDQDKFENHLEYRHRRPLGKKFRCRQCLVQDFIKETELHKHLEEEHFEEVWCKVCGVQLPHPRVLSDHLRDGHPKISDSNIAEEEEEECSIINVIKHSGDNEEEEVGNETCNSNENNNQNDTVEETEKEEEEVEYIPNPKAKNIEKKIEQNLPKSTVTLTTDSTEKTSRYIQCTECSKYYAANRIGNHRQQAHQLPRFICKFCKVDFFTNDDYKRHLEVVHPKRFECSECNQLFLELDKFTKHLEYKHRLFPAGKNFRCRQCLIPDFIRESDLYMHLEDEHFEEVWCKICEIRFPHPRVLSNHLRSRHSKFRRTITDCNIAEEKNINEEEEEEEDGNETCNSINNDLTDYDTAEETVDEEEQEEEYNPNSLYKKKKIGKKQKLVESSTDLTTDSTETTTPRYIQCPECSKYYTSRRIFIHRQEAHQLPRFICRFCKADFCSDIDCKRHIEIVHRERFKCSQCHREFLEQHKYTKHMEHRHRIFPLGKKFQCRQCNLVPEFTKAKELHQHLEEHHFEEVWCRVCERRFPHPRVLSSHLRSGHNKKAKVKKLTEQGLPVPRQRNYNGRCPVCKLNCSFHPELLRHLRDQHGMNIVEKEITFRTISEFNRWRFETEKRTKAYFCREKSSSTNGMSSEHYYCNRSGIHKPNPRKVTAPRASWGQTKKINATCPARIVMTLNQANEIKVRYVLEHVGHECELKYLPLSNFDQRKVEDMLRSGMTIVQTYEACRNLKPSASVRDDTVERLNVIDKYSIRYIANKLRKTSKVAIAYCRPPRGPNSAPARKRKKRPTKKPPAIVNVVADNQVDSSKNVSIGETATAISTLMQLNSGEYQQFDIQHSSHLNPNKNNNVIEIINQIPVQEVEICGSGEGGKLDISNENVRSPGRTDSSTNGNYSDDNGGMDIDFNDNEVVPLSSNLTTKTTTTTIVPIATTSSSEFQILPDKSLIRFELPASISASDFSSAAASSSAILEPHSFSVFEVPTSSSGVGGATDHSYHILDNSSLISVNSTNEQQQQQQENDSMLDYLSNYWNCCDLEQRSKISKILQPKFDEHKRRLTEKVGTKPTTTTATTTTATTYWTRNQF